jgi:hypothetical protein
LIQRLTNVINTLGKKLTESDWLKLASEDLSFTIIYSERELNVCLCNSDNRHQLVIRPEKIPVLQEIVRACLKVAWLNIFVDYQVFQNLLAYITYVTLASLKSRFQTNRKHRFFVGLGYSSVTCISASEAYSKRRYIKMFIIRPIISIMHGTTVMKLLGVDNKGVV